MKFIESPKYNIILKTHIWVCCWNCKLFRKVRQKSKIYYCKI